jgi:putative aldouronate transport system substrate-binding protein
MPEQTRRRNMRKTIALFLIVVLAAGMAFAAGQQGDSAEVASGPRYPDNVDPFGKYDPAITLSFAKESNAATDFPEGDSYEDNVWMRSIAEDLGINLEAKFIALGGPKYETKLNLAIASNDLPDVMTLTNATQFSKLLNAGKLEDLTEAYDKFLSPLARKYYEADGGTIKSWGTAGGRIYGMARGSISTQNYRLIHIRKDWREDLGIPEPKTMNDVLAMAEAFKAVDPDNRFGISITKDILDNGMSDMTGIANSLGAYPRRWVEKNGKLVYGSVQPEMKDVLAVYRDLYAKGLIDPEFPVKDGGASAPALTNSKVGIILGDFWLESWPLNSLFDSEGVDWELYPILPMEGYQGKVMVQAPNSPRQMYAVRKGFEYPEAFFKIMNYQVMKLNDPEEAETDKFHSDGEYAYHMFQPFYSGYSPLTVNLDSNPNVTNAIDKNDTSYLVTPHDHIQYERVKRYVDAVDAGAKPAPSDWVSYKFFYGEKSSFGVLNQYFHQKQAFVSPATGIETDEMARRQGSLNQVEEQIYVEIITGKKPLDAFDGWVEDWTNLGGAVIEYEINEWYQSVQ